jgi:hypothetical protein
MAVDPPLSVQPGDTFRTVGRQLFQERNSVVIAIRDIGTIEVFEPSLDVPATIDHAVIFRRTHMSGIALTLVDVQTTGNDVLASFSDGTSLSTDLPSLQQQVADVNQNTDLAKQLLLAALIARQPTLNDANAISGSTVSIDMAGSSPISFNLVSNV